MTASLSFAFVIAGCVHDPQRNARYQIKYPILSPAPGQQFTNETVVISRSRSVRAFPELKGETNTLITIALQAVSQIVAADTNTQSAEVKLNVDRLESASMGVTNLLLSGGAAIKARFLLGERFFSRGEGSLPLATQHALEAVIEPWRTGERFESSDDVSGFAQPRRVGESWTIDDLNLKQRLLGAMRRVGRELKPDSVAFRIQFVGLTNMLENECFHMRTSIVVTSRSSPDQFEPPPLYSWTKHHNTIRITVDHIFPRDHTKILLWTRMLDEFELNAVATGPGGKGSVTLAGQKEKLEFIQLLPGTDQVSP